jgi:hypothetical protein
MNLPIFLEIAIGLVFIYLVLSLLAAEIQELISTILQWRAQHLKDSIINLLSGDNVSDSNVQRAQELAQQIYEHPALTSINQEAKGFLALLFRSFTWIPAYIYRLVTGRESEFGNQRTAPSYIPASAFSKALIGQLGAEQLINKVQQVKFIGFHDQIIKEIILISGLSRDEKEIQAIKERFKEIEEKLNNGDNATDQKSTNSGAFTFEQAIQETSNALDELVQKFKPSTGETNQISEVHNLQNIHERLLAWKSTLFENRNGLVAIGKGLKPTLYEVVEALDTSSRLYKMYQEKFKKYDIKRQRKVKEELNEFHSLMLVFFENCFLSSHHIQMRGKKALNNLIPKEVLANDKEFLFPLYELPNKMWKAFKDESPTPKDKTDTSAVSAFELPSKVLKKVTYELPTKVEGKKFKAFIAGFSGYRGYSVRSGNLFEVFKISTIAATIIAVIYTTLAIAGDNLYSLAESSKGIQLLTSWSIIFIFAFLILWFIDWLKKYKLPNHRTSIYSVSYFDLLIREGSESFKRKLNPEKYTCETYFHLGHSFYLYLQDIIHEYADVNLQYLPLSVRKNLAQIAKETKLTADSLEDQLLELSEEVEHWFDASMDRASGVYKRNAKGVSILIGFLLAAATNASSIHVINRLAYDSALREALVNTSTEIVSDTGQQASGGGTDTNISDNESGLSEAQIEGIEKAAKAVELPIGWHPKLIYEEMGGCLISPASGNNNQGQVEVLVPASTWQDLFDQCIFREETQVSLPGDSDVLPNNSTTQKKKLFCPNSPCHHVFCPR